MNHPEHYLCRICRTTLDVIDVNGERTFRHADATKRAFGVTVSNHFPQPILASSVGGEQVGVCDFCSEPHPTWRYPCQTFEVETPHFVPTDVGMGMVGDWGACEACHALIEADDYNGLCQRACATFGHALPGPVIVAMRAMHQQFKRSRTGDAIDLLSLS